MRRMALVLVVWLCVGLMAHSQSGAQKESDYVGAETCKTCHAQQAQSVEHSRHAGVAPAGHLEAAGCESCHGPGRAHVEAGGDASKIASPKNMDPRRASQMCLGCHETSATHANFVGSAHMKGNVGCTGCHSVHQARTKEALLRAPAPQLCYSCHAETVSDFSKPSHHRVNEGLIKCSDCHDVHGSLLRSQVRTAHWQQLTCVGCHQDTAGPFQYEHSPVKVEGCTACHTPHGSANPHLLTRPNVNQLCLSCHSEILATAAPNIPTFHNQAQKYQSCTLCHVAVHGSNTDQFLFRH